MPPSPSPCSAPIHHESHNLELKIWDLVEDYNISNVLSQYMWNLVKIQYKS
jgi:hypothetical protein